MKRKGMALVLALLVGFASNAQAATASLSTQLTITITGHFPNAITFSPAAPTVPWNVPVGTVVAAISATNADGSAFNGTLALTDASGDFAISGSNIVTAKALTASNIGTVTVTVAATE